MLEPIYTEQIDFPYNKRCVSLKDQANSMQKFISSLQEQLQCRDVELRALRQERDQLTLDLRKFKKFYTNVRQQLAEEREFYLQEKECYCKETLRHKYTEDLKHRGQLAERVKETEDLRSELAELKVSLNETAGANYNLSIKFLRMKNTKRSVQARLKTMETENTKLVADLRAKLEQAESETLHIISDRFQHPMPPSNKRYLHVLKQNTQLVHQNLGLQTEVSALCNSIERIKADNVKFETQLRLRYARNVATADKTCTANLGAEATLLPSVHADTAAGSDNNDNTS